MDEDQGEISTAESQKNRLKTFMNDKSRSNDHGGSLVDKSMSSGRPIADLFPSVTVLFGDIAG